MDSDTSGSESASDSGSGDTGECPLGGEFPAIDESSCEPLGTDYQPLDAMSANDMWAACVSDDGAYHLVDTSPSTIARVEAYEMIAELLWRNGTPDADAFTDARVAYAADEGLESRMLRREDLHYPEIPLEDWDPGVDADKQCTVPANVTKYPDRCVGPASIAPLLNEAFAAGQTGEGDPNVHAARIQASLLWFFYVSTYKEAFTCTSVPKDCDSSWAYYSGGFDRAAGIGMAGELKPLSGTSHSRVFDGILAARCWRDLYPGDMYATLADVPMAGQDLFALGWEQLDVALHRAFAVLVRERIEAQAMLCGAEADANWAFVQVAGRVLDRESEQRDEARAATLAQLWAKDPSSLTNEDLEAGVAALDAVFPCP